jgi:hypothetical protein
MQQLKNIWIRLETKKKYIKVWNDQNELFGRLLWAIGIYNFGGKKSSEWVIGVWPYPSLFN